MSDAVGLLRPRSNLISCLSFFGGALGFGCKYEKSRPALSPTSSQPVSAGVWVAEAPKIVHCLPLIGLLEPLHLTGQQSSCKCTRYYPEGG